MLKNKVKMSKTKTLILGMASFLVLSTIIGGTYAWLTGKTMSLNSTFTYGNIKITINDGNENNNQTTNNYEIMPGNEIEKNTNIKVIAKSEDCWLFIKIDKTDNFDDFMNYEVDDGWITLDEEKNVYYREVSKSNDDQIFDVIKNKVIKVKPEITREMLSTLRENKNYPTFSVTAYAVQRNSKMDALSTASKAWLLVNNQDQ